MAESPLNPNTSDHTIRSTQFRLQQLATQIPATIESRHTKNAKKAANQHRQHTNLYLRSIRFSYGSGRITFWARVSPAGSGTVRGESGLKESMVGNKCGSAPLKSSGWMCLWTIPPAQDPVVHSAHCRWPATTILQSEGGDTLTGVRSRLSRTPALRESTVLSMASNRFQWHGPGKAVVSQSVCGDQ